MSKPAGIYHRRFALRARVTTTFALGGLLLTAVLSLTTYALARTYMLDQRETTATRQAFLNARLVKDLISGDAPDPKHALEVLQGESGTTSLIHLAGRWYASSVAASPESIPADLLAAVDSGDAARRRVKVNGKPQIVIGTPIVAVGAQYFEFAPIENLERTLRILAGSLAVASGITAVAGAALGWYASRRLLRPLERVSVAAVSIAGGQLDTRLDHEGDEDLEQLVQSFNEMAAALQERIEREARFASDVSHELRTPLTALATAVQVVRARADDLPTRTRLAVDVLETQIAYFQRLVLDLLEISRFDAGASTLALEDVDVGALVSSVVASYQGVTVEIDENVGSAFVDARRVERVLVNLLDNAERHAGGPTRVQLRRSGDFVQLAVKDHGPGIPDADLSRVFDRFWRGPSARQQAVKGTGLGLSLVAEHVRVHGGRVHVEQLPAGGSRFVVDIPAPETPRQPASVLSP